MFWWIKCRLLITIFNLGITSCSQHLLLELQNIKCRAIELLSDTYSIICVSSSRCLTFKCWLKIFWKLSIFRHKQSLLTLWTILQSSNSKWYSQFSYVAEAAWANFHCHPLFPSNILSSIKQLKTWILNCGERNRDNPLGW